MNGHNGVAVSTATLPVVEELWTAPQFSVSPGFNDDFNRLLGAQTTPQQEPVPASTANTLLQYSVNMNENLGLSPIPHETPVRSDDVAAPVSPPKVETSEEDRRKHLIERGRAALEDWRSCKDNGAKFLVPEDDKDDLQATHQELKLKEAEETIVELKKQLEDLSQEMGEKDATIEGLKQQSYCTEDLGSLSALKVSLQEAEDRATKATMFAQQKSDVASTLAIEVANLQTALDRSKVPEANEDIHTTNEHSLELEQAKAERIKAEKESAKWQSLYQESHDKNLHLERSMQDMRVEINSELSLTYENQISEMTIKLHDIQRGEETLREQAEKEKEAYKGRLKDMEESMRMGDEGNLKDEVQALNSENERLASMLQEREDGDMDQVVNERDTLKVKLSEMMNGGDAERIAHLEMQVLKLTGELADSQQDPANVDTMNRLVARSEQLENQLAAATTGGMTSGDALRARQKEKEWNLERERYTVFQRRLEGETERQRSLIADYEDTIATLKEELINKGGELPVESPKSPVPPSPELPPVPPVAVVASTAPIPAPATQKRLLNKSAVSLPLSVMVFEAIFSLGGLLPSTRHAQHAHLTGEFKV
eukprot:TRINITY_DN21433_c0_g1_i1.p1 TRINITY_DN21433_c0_g1~~TRINITY_DN21433_c0_g1_i1.p1  ORF type:complete len:621 (+),score=189.99 TRINITY_DN21433_c0_g1_i1:69-1865(+)